MKEQTNEYYCVGRFCTDSDHICYRALCRKNIDGTIRSERRRFCLPRDSQYGGPDNRNATTRVKDINCVRKNIAVVKKIARS